MAYDAYTAERITAFFERKQTAFYTKKMMGGLAFMVDNKMCCGLLYSKKKELDLLMVRIGEAAMPEALQRKGSLSTGFTDRPMKGYLFITPEGYDLEEDLDYWLKLCLDFNPLAKASPKRKKKS